MLEAPVQMHTPALKSVLESANPAWTRSVQLDAPGQRHGQQPVSGTADPGVVKQDNSSRGSVDTTKTRSDPQRVRMSSGERPIGAAKRKQPNTKALCQPPAQPMSSHCLPDGKCQPQWHLQRTVPPPNRSDDISNRLPNRLWGRLRGSFHSIPF